MAYLPEDDPLAGFFHGRPLQRVTLRTGRRPEVAMVARLL